MGGRFAGGLEELPLTLVYCTWFGTVAVAQNYLWCAEKAWLSSVALFAGLAVNVSLDLVLLPRYGLHGAVMATTVANFTALSLTYLLNNRLGMRVSGATWLLAFAPMLLWLGPVVAALGLGALLVISLATPWLFMREEKQHLLVPAAGFLQTIHARFGRRLARRTAKEKCWPLSAGNHEASGP